METIDTRISNIKLRIAKALEDVAELTSGKALPLSQIGNTNEFFRSLAIARTNLEQADMWTDKAKHAKNEGIISPKLPERYA